MRRDPDAIIFGLTAASAAAVVVSIAASQILLTVAYALWIYKLFTKPGPVRWPPYFRPLLAFMALTLLSLAMSPEPTEGFHSIQKYVLFPMGLLAANFVTSETPARTAYSLLLLTATITAVAGIVEFGFRYSQFLQTGLRKTIPPS